jgi:cardiolipin synthase
LSAPVVGWLILEQRLTPALVLSLIAAASDWLDGYLARRLGSISKIGEYLDPAGDKLLLATAFVCLGLIGQIPRWLVGLVIGRDLVIVIGSLLLWRLRNRTDFQPVFSGKLSTAFQILTVLAILLESAFSTKLLYGVKLLGFAGASIFTCVSGYLYVRKGIRMASRNQPAVASTFDEFDK